MPRTLACAARCTRRHDLRCAHGKTLACVNLLGGRYVILRGRDDCPVAHVFRPAVGDVDHAVRQHRRPIPVEELRCAEIAVSVHPRAIFDMHDIVRGHGMVVQVLLHDRRLVTLTFRGRHEVRHGLHVVRVASAPRVVAVVCEHDEHRPVRIVEGFERAEFADAHRVVSIKPTKMLRAGDDGDETLDARFGVHVLRAMRRERKRHSLCRAAAARNRNASIVRLRGVELVGLVRRIAVDAARAVHDGKISARA